MLSPLPPSYNTSHDIPLVKQRLAVVLSRGERVAVGVSVERKQTDREAEGVQDLVFDGGQEDLQLLRLGADTVGTEVSMSRDRPEGNKSFINKCIA